MPEALTKKIGPLPVWAWALIIGGTIGAVVLLRRGSGTSAQGAPTDPNADTAQIDPTTGLPYSGMGSGGGVATSSAPSLATEIGDVTGAFQALQAAGFLQPATAGGTGLVQLAPGATYYDPTTGDVVHGDATNAAVDQASGSVQGATTSGSPLERAAAAVTKGKVGPINTRRLLNAGYSQAQIDFHVSHKSPLGQPANAVKPNVTKATPTPVHPAATHPLQHVTAAPSHHGSHPTPLARSRGGTHTGR